jgi:hypothetical protein
MIGTIRKHSKWLWWVIAGLTIITFLYWGAAPATRNSGGVGGGSDFGSLYGRKITQQDYVNSRNEFYLFYWFRNHDWPNRNANLKEKDLDEQIYLRMMLTQKAESLGVHVSDEAAAAAASDLLRSLGRNSQSVSIEQFIKQILTPEGLTSDDFARFASNDLVIQQLVQTLGLPGSLITPQEAAAAYQREHQEVSAQVVFISASNFVSQVIVTPAAVAQFYTNYLAQYRLPDRVQVNYVEFNLDNFLAQAKTELAKSNLDNIVDANYRQLGPDYFPDAKTPEAAKAKILDALFHQQALADARAQASGFATAVFNLNPSNSPQAGDLATVAKQKGLTVRVTAPFSSLNGPEEFNAPETFTKAAFALTSDEPLAGPILGPTAIYVIALDKQLPSVIVPLDDIRDRVARDFRMVQAIMLAQRAGTNFAPELAGQMMGGRSFASACSAAGLQPVTLPPFSLSTQELPELGERMEPNQFMRIVATIADGQASPFVQTRDGGLIVYVKSRKAADQAAMKADLPQFTAELRRARTSDAFNQWVQTEASAQLRTTPVFAQKTATGGK